MRQEHADCAQRTSLADVLDEVGVLVQPFPHHIPDFLEVVGEFAVFQCKDEEAVTTMGKTVKVQCRWG